MSKHPRIKTGSTFVVTTICPARIDADFDRSSSIDADDGEQRKRIIRPGAILLANLDMDGAPPTTTTYPLPDLVGERDADDQVLSGGNDRDELGVLEVSNPASGAFSASQIQIRVHAGDAARIRMFHLDPTPPVVVLGDGSSLPEHNHDIPISPSRSFTCRFGIEATTLAGTPGRRGPGKATAVPVPPDGGSPGFDSSPSGVADPANVKDRTKPIYASRAPGEIWIEFAHYVGGEEDADQKEVALFTIAPYMLLSNLQPAERIYVTLAAQSRNHGFVYDLAEALNQAFGGGVDVPASTSTPFVPSRPATYTGSAAKRPALDRLYIIDGSEYRSQWVQDEFEIGYCWAPQASMHVVLHCKRSGNQELGRFVRRELCGRDVALYDGLGTRGDSLNFGGNLEVSPPVNAATKAQKAGAAGPAIPAQPTAPFGKILVGDHTRRIHRHFRRFLKAQKVQPYVPVNTSWLAVAHIDEIISFVPSNSGKGFKLLIASILMARKLLDAVKAVKKSRTNLFRGKRWWEVPVAADGSHNAEISVEQLRTRARKANEKLRKKILTPIEKRLKSVLNLSSSDVVRIPVWFDPKPSGVPTAAFTPDMVNMLVVGNHVMVPKPFGPRLRQADAEKILRDKIKVSSAAPGSLATLKGHYHWGMPGEAVADMASVFGVTEAAILGDSRNSGLSSGALADARRIWIPEDNVDLFEAYVHLVLAEIGLTVHFIDDWDTYHSAEGEIHCGTNAKRTPPEAASGYSGPYWWDHYEKAL